MKIEIANLARKNILELKPYSSARDEYKGPARIFLDANENGLGSPIVIPGVQADLNRYPDPYQVQLKQAIGRLKNTDARNIFLGNGSDECIDLLFRCFCNPGKDNVIICPPTYGMYEVSANINDVEVRKAALSKQFQLDVAQIMALADGNTKLLWICNPNNPTGNKFRKDDLVQLLNRFNGLVVIDEAYIDFSSEPSWLEQVSRYDNLVVLQTFSKAWGLAGLRLGMAFASPEIISVLNKVKPPYNISHVTQESVATALARRRSVKNSVARLVRNRKHLEAEIRLLPITLEVYPSEANFLLVRMVDPRKVYKYLLESGVVVRDRSNIELCEGCLRITVGNANDNRQLIQSLLKYQDETVIDN